MSDKGAKPTKVNRRSVYMTRARPNKKLQIWIPPSINVNDYANPLALLLSQLTLIAEPIDTSAVYANDFENYYNINIKPKYDDKIIHDSDSEHVKQLKRKKRVYFCASDDTGGVDVGYIVQTANRRDTVTIISVDVDETSGNILEVYAIASFNVSGKKMAVHVSTLCGNQVLPPSGEGTRLLKLIETKGHGVGLSKVFLDPVNSAIPYYESQRYRVMDKRDSSGSSKSYSSSSNSSNSSNSGNKIHMQKNTRAQKHWNKIRTAYNLGISLSRTRKSTIARNLKDEQKRIKEAEIASRPALTGKSINPVGFSLGIPEESSRKSTKMTRGRSVVPGDSLKGNRTMKMRRNRNRNRH